MDGLSKKINNFKLIRSRITGGAFIDTRFDTFIAIDSTICNTNFYNIEFPIDKNQFILKRSIFKDNNYSGVEWGGYLGNNVTYYDGYLDEQKTIEVESSDMKEAYRMLKHEHDQIGNKTEANKFFAKEMEYYEKSLSWKTDLDKKLISMLQRFSNNYGNSWLRPSFWIVFVSFLYTFSFDCWNFNCTCGGIQDWNCFSSHWLKNVSQFPTELKNAKDWSFFIYAIIMGTLFYQLLVALRRISQR